MTPDLSDQMTSVDIVTGGSNVLSIDRWMDDQMMRRRMMRRILLLLMQLVLIHKNYDIPDNDEKG